MLKEFALEENNQVDVITQIIKLRTWWMKKFFGQIALYSDWSYTFSYRILEKGFRMHYILVEIILSVTGYWKKVLECTKFWLKLHFPLQYIGKGLSEIALIRWFRFKIVMEVAVNIKDMEWKLIEVILSLTGYWKKPLRDSDDKMIQI